MEQRPIPATGERLPVIGCGTYRGFDVTEGSAADRQLSGVLEALFAAGGAVVDSSPMYGHAEQATGRLLAQMGGRDRAFLATKVWTRGRATGIAQMEQSLRLLRTDHVDLMQIHNLVDWQTHLDTLAGWKAERRIRYVGVTHYHSGAHAELAQVITRDGIDFVQLNYSLDDRAAEERLLPLAMARGVAVIVNVPFGGGRLVRAAGARAAARLRGPDRDHELAATAPEVRARPSGGHLRHPRHRQSRAHGWQCSRRPGRSPGRPGAYSRLVAGALTCCAHDHGDEILLDSFADRHLADRATLPHDDGAVGHANDLIHVVADDDDRQAPLGQAFDHVRISSDSRTPSAAVGSSRMITRRANATALATATAWRCPPDIRPISCEGETWLTLSALACSRHCLCSSLADRKPSGPSQRGQVRSRPIKKLSDTVRLSNTARSWNTVSMPDARASAGERSRSGCPSRLISPNPGPRSR